MTDHKYAASISRDTSLMAQHEATRRAFTSRNLAGDQLLALSMARHPRLGAASAAASLNEDCGRRILQYVRASHAAIVAMKRIFLVRVKTGDLVDRVEFHYADGKVSAHGGHGGRWCPDFILGVGEFITDISGQVGDSLDAISFVTNHGREARFAGRLNGGRRFVKPFSAHDLEMVDVQFKPHPGGWLRGPLDYETRVPFWNSREAKLLFAHPSGPLATSRSAMWPWG